MFTTTRNTNHLGTDLYVHVNVYPPVKDMRHGTSLPNPMGFENIKKK
jgi:hypothetical protein